MKIYTNELGHITKYYHGCSNYHTGLTLTHFMSRLNLVTKRLYGGKKIFFLTIAALDLKVA